MLTLEQVAPNAVLLLTALFLQALEIMHLCVQERLRV